VTTVLKVLLACVGVFVLLIASFFFFNAEDTKTAAVTKTANDFFLAVKNKDMDRAHTYLSEHFQAETSNSDLQRYFEKHFLNNIKEVSWNAHSISGDRGGVAGFVTTDSDETIPISLSFVNDATGWKIYTIRKTSLGTQDEASHEMPSEQDLIRLVNLSMSVFAESVSNKSMVKLHSHVSNLWQQQFSPEKFDEAFSSFFDLGLDLRLLEDFSPQFITKPRIDKDGILVITGLYPTQPNQVHFEQKYLYEGLRWKLVGFSTDIK